MTTFRRRAAGALLAAALAAPAAAQPAPAPTAVAAGDRLDGFLPLRLDAATGRVLLELPGDTTRALLLTSLATGLGSNPVGLDRGANGDGYVARFERAGGRVLVVLENWKYRSSDTANAAHQRTVAEAFPPSTIAALPVVPGPGPRLVVDATDLFVRDWLDVGRTLARAGQGSYALARDRSGVYRPATRNFPRNTEVDVALTFTTTGPPGPIVDAIAPAGDAVTLREHVSLLPLPTGYRPREADPRVGYFGVRFQDYARPLDRPLGVTWVSRHRLERGPDGRVANPIVYYVDPGIPEPIRTATMQGVKWWEDAFARAGLPGGLRVEWLPAGADPADARYNVVQWENRNERGWSIGGSLGDPRTGEIVKAMARMDSHRARTDAIIYAALAGADPTPAETAFVLARVRQVSAHEVGHTLGLAHNYIASAYGRGSVMDYPAPRVLPRADGTLDFSQAYAVGPGDYDVWAIRWGYGIFPAASEADSLRAIVAEGLGKGYLYLSDADARPEFASDPRVNLWDDAAGEDEYWTRTVAVRRLAMAHFSERAVRPGDPIALAQERFVPLYFWHRFALNRLAKTLGGVEYANAVRGDGQQATRPVAPARQRRALAAVAGALAPAELAVPDTVRALLAPGADDVTPGVELFAGRARPVFDELGAARTLASMIVDAALQRDRAARLVQQHLHDPGQPGLADVADALLGAATPVHESPRDAALRRVAHRAVVDRLLALAADTAASPEVRAMAELKLGEVGAAARRALARGTGNVDARAHLLAVAGEIERWQQRREPPRPTPALVAPPGDPFGEDW
ncbi:hypothetical protein tb265_24020 [Gemmatimonadetes bacterium T265]|nr:hypothetical protein tb265_24020 [Gemmatimonadetes bacterium T265]